MPISHLARQRTGEARFIYIIQLKIVMFNGEIPVYDWMHDFARYDVTVVP